MSTGFTRVLVFCLLVACITSIDTRIPLIAIISTPLGESGDGMYFNPRDTKSMIKKSIADYVDQSGAIPVLLPFHLDKSKLTKVLDQVHAIIIPDGDETTLFSDGIIGTPSDYLQTLDFIIKYVGDENKKGRFLPLLGIDLGMEAIVISSMGLDPSLRNCLFDNIKTSAKIIKTADWDSSKMFSTFNYETTERAFNSGNLYFNHVCGFLAEELLKNKKFMDKFKVIGISYTKHNDKVASILEHRDYPILAIQFHPEANQFEALNSYWIKRTEDDIIFCSEIILNIAESVRMYSRRFEALPDIVKPYFEENLQPIMLEGQYAIRQAYIFTRTINIENN